MGAYVSEYLSWRSQPLWLRLAGYRHYYVGPELDRLEPLFAVASMIPLQGEF